jgi:hypothetical protein
METAWWSEYDEGVMEGCSEVESMEVRGSLAAKWSMDVAVGREGGAKEGGRFEVRQAKLGSVVCRIRPLCVGVVQSDWRSPPSMMRACGYRVVRWWIAEQISLYF